MIIAGADPGFHGRDRVSRELDPVRVVGIVDMPLARKKSGRHELLLHELVADCVGALDGRRCGHLWLEKVNAFAPAGRRMGASSAFSLGERYASCGCSRRVTGGRSRRLARRSGSRCLLPRSRQSASPFSSIRTAARGRRLMDAEARPGDGATGQWAAEAAPRRSTARVRCNPWQGRRLEYEESRTTTCIRWERGKTGVGPDAVAGNTYAAIQAEQEARDLAIRRRKLGDEAQSTLPSGVVPPNPQGNLELRRTRPGAAGWRGRPRSELYASVTCSDTPNHPRYWITWTPRLERYRQRMLKTMQRAADKVVQRILRETAQWMVARPKTPAWRLPKPTAAFANWSWITRATYAGRTISPASLKRQLIGSSKPSGMAGSRSQ